MSATYRQQMDEAMACNTKEEAREWLEKEVQRYGKEFGIEREKALNTIKIDLGYLAGYYDQETSKKMCDFFGAAHPIFGTPDYWDTITPEQAFREGTGISKGVNHVP